MQYLLMIYDTETMWRDMPEAQRAQLFGEYMQFTADLKKSGHHLCRSTRQGSVGLGQKTVDQELSRCK